MELMLALEAQKPLTKQQTQQIHNIKSLDLLQLIKNKRLKLIIKEHKMIIRKKASLNKRELLIIDFHLRRLVVKTILKIFLLYMKNN